MLTINSESWTACAHVLFENHQVSCSCNALLCSIFVNIPFISSPQVGYVHTSGCVCTHETYETWWAVQSKYRRAVVWVCVCIVFVKMTVLAFTYIRIRTVWHGPCSSLSISADQVSGCMFLFMVQFACTLQLQYWIHACMYMLRERFYSNTGVTVPKIQVACCWGQQLAS